MTPAGTHQLSWWRFAAGCAVFLGLAADLSLLAPVYYRNYQLDHYLAGTLRGPALNETENQLRDDVIARAKSLDLPLIPNDIHIDRQNGVTTLRTFYKIQVDLGLYTVDLHFRPEASSR